MLKQDNWKVYRDIFSNSFFELVLRDNQMCFRDYDTCHEKLKEVYEKYTGNSWKDEATE